MLGWHPWPTLLKVSPSEGPLRPAVAGVASLADSAEVVCSSEITIQERRGALDGSVFNCGDCCNGSLGYRNDEHPGDWGGCPGGTLLADPK